jgi:hypothetical protein
MFSNLLSALRTEPQPTAIRVISVTGPTDYSELPQGFFRVVTASGKEGLGYNGAFLCWDVGTTVVVGRERITLSVPREELPLVKLNFRKQQDGVVQVGSVGVIDTDSIGGDGSVSWTGSPQRDGVDCR